MSVDSVISFVADNVPAVVETAADAVQNFGNEFLSGLNTASIDIAANAGAVADQVGSFAGSGSFWDTFSPGTILDKATAGISDFFNPNAGIALTEQFAGQTPGDRKSTR